MKTSAIAILLYVTSLAVAAPHPSTPRGFSICDPSPLGSYAALEKRGGGGGGEGGGGGGGSSGGGSDESSSSSSSSGGKGGDTTSGSGSRPASSYSFSPSSNLGGRTKDGSGTIPSYDGRFAGGAVVPFTAGKKSPTQGVVPYAFPVAGFTVFPGRWRYSTVYAYPFGYPYYWNDAGQNRTSNVTCLCQRYQVCGCDPDGNSTFLNELVGNGTDHPVNRSTVRTVDFGNGSVSTFINGSLANGTTASGGTDPSNKSQISAGVKFALSYAGYWVMVGTVITGVMMV